MDITVDITPISSPPGIEGYPQSPLRGYPMSKNVFGFSRVFWGHGGMGGWPWMRHGRRHSA